LVDESYDAYFRYDDVNTRAVRSHALIEHDLCLCATPEYFTKYGTLKNIDDLNEHNCIIHQINRYEGEAWDFQTPTGPQQIKATGNLSLNNAALVLEDVLSGVGIARIPRYYVQEYLQNKQLQEVLKLNPTFNVGSTKIPQIPDLNGTTTNKTWASFWVESVSADSTSKEQEEAWKFLDWLSQPEQQLERFNETQKYKPYGEIYSDMSLINNLLTSPYLTQIVLQAPYSTTAPVGEGAGNNEYVDLFHNATNKFLYEKSIRDEISVMQKLKEDYLKVKY